MNIFNLSVKEIEEEMNKVLKEVTPEQLLEELLECGYKKKEIKEIEEEVKEYNYMEQNKFSINSPFCYYENLHINCTSSQKKLININNNIGEVA